MRYFYILVIFFALVTPSFFAQNKTYSLSLFYNINESSSQNNFARVDSLYDLLGSGSCTLSLYGYADFLHNDCYNLNLSQKRADAVKNYLLKKENGSKISIAVCKGIGEKNSKDNQSVQGEASQRRVDVIITQETTFKKIGTRENKIQAEPKKEIIPEKKNIEDLEKGESLAVEGLSFIPGRHMVTQSALPAMKKLLETLKEHPQLRIEIQGHVCCPGDGHPDGLDFDTQEYKLSENRAKAIYNFLIKNGIEKERLTYKGYGRSHPKVEMENNVEEEQMNRRVEIKILEN